MKKNRNLISLSVSLAFVIAIAAYLTFHKNEVLSVMSISPVNLCILVILGIVFTGILGLTNQRLVAVFGINLTAKEWFGLAVLTTAGNYFMPLRGGASVRAVYLKKRYNFLYSEFLSTMIGFYLLTFWIASSLGIILAVIIYLVQGTLSTGILSFFITVNILISFILFFSPRVPENCNAIFKFLKKLMDGWVKIKKNRRLIFNLEILSLLGYAVKALQLLYAYKALAFSVNFLGISLLSVLLVFTIFINITPANMGIQEAIISFFSAAFGMGFSEGLLAALLFRSINMLVAFTLGPLFSYLLLKHGKDNKSTQ